MKYTGAIWVIMTSLLLAACKMEIEVPEGGRISSSSGSIGCAAGESCTVDISDINFDETFIAVAEEGYVFSGWSTKHRSFCGGKLDECRLYTSGFVGNEILMAFLSADDEVFYLAPTFSLSWLVNNDGARSQYIFEDSSNLGVLVNVQSVSETTVGNAAYTYVEATGIPDYAVQLTAADVSQLNDRPEAATDFTSGRTTAAAGDLIEFGQDVGYRNNPQQDCAVGAGYGYWPPGPVCPSGQDKSGYFPQEPVITSDECETSTGVVGFAVNGVSIFNWSDGKSYNDAGVWQTLAPFAEVYDVDICGGHAADGEYHHHFYTTCWGDVAGEDEDGHSELLGFAADGYAVYGPWFDTGVLANSCWVARDYSQGSATGGGCDDGDRSCTLNDVYDISKGTTPVTDASSTPSLSGSYSSLSGNAFPTVSGFFKEDYYFDTACGASGGANLDKSNGHDHGTLGYHYHVTVSADDNITPVYPFIFGPTYKGELADNSVTSCSRSGPDGGMR